MPRLDLRPPTRRNGTVVSVAAASPSIATEPYLFRERQYRFARYGLCVLAIGVAWTFIRWPDARRVPVACTVVAHQSSMMGKRGHDAKVEVHVDDEDAWFTVVNRSASAEEENAAFAEWPIGATKNCWRLPYPSAEDAITASGASWLPSLIVMLIGFVISGSALFRARARTVHTNGAKSGNPYRDAGQREQIPPPPRYRLSMRASLPSARRKAWIALAFWTLLFGAPVVLTLTATSPMGSVLEPGSMAREGVFLFLLIALGIPGGVIFWPAFYALLARKTVTLDASGGVLGTSDGLPFLAVTQWLDLHADLMLEGVSLIEREGGKLVYAFPKLETKDQQAIIRWLDDFRLFVADPR